MTGYKDISPRGGVAYDLFGNGKTAVKVNFGKYLEPTSNNNNYILSNPIARIATTTARELDRHQQQLRARTAICGIRRHRTSRPPVVDICGAMNSQTFGTATQTTAAIDPKILNGWGVRSNDWQIGASVQQQVLPRVSVEVGYFRRWLNNFTVTDNLALSRGRLHAVQHHGAVGSAAAWRRRLRRSTGCTTSCRASSARPATTSRSRTTSAISISSYNGVLFNVSARLGAGVQFQGGINTRQDRPGQLRRARAGAGVDDRRRREPGGEPRQPVLPQRSRASSPRPRRLAATPCRRSTCSIAGTFRSDQGGVLAANWNAPVALVSAALGRPAAVVGTTVPINLVAPGQVWGDRVNAFDLRFAKILRFGRTRYNVGVDIINVTNSDAILTYNQNFNPAVTTGSQAWLAPQSVLTPRFFKIGAQIDF